MLTRIRMRSTTVYVAPWDDDYHRNAVLALLEAMARLESAPWLRRFRRPGRILTGMRR